MPPELDINALATEIGNDLFPPTPPPSGSEGDTPPPPADPPVGTPPPPAPIDPVAQLEALNRDFPLPKSWKKEAEPVWAKLELEARELVAKREADISRGIQQYQEGYTRWDTLIKPFLPVLQQHPNVDPVGLMQSLMNSHLTLLSGDAAAKKAKALELLAAYGITDLTGGGSPPPIPPEFMNRVSGVEQMLQNFMVTEQKKVVDAFFKDPKNEYAEELAPEIQRLLTTGAADSLQSAYEQAMWLTPSVREKQLAKAYTERKRLEQEEAKKRAGLNGLNRDSSVEVGTPAPVKGTVDDTIAGIVAKYSGTH